MFDLWKRPPLLSQQMMLGLISHEPHFSLLREEVKFTKSQKRLVASF